MLWTTQRPAGYLASAYKACLKVLARMGVRSGFKHSGRVAWWLRWGYIHSLDARRSSCYDHDDLLRKRSLVVLSLGGLKIWTFRGPVGHASKAFRAYGQHHAHEGVLRMHPVLSHPLLKASPHSINLRSHCTSHLRVIVPPSLTHLCFSESTLLHAPVAKAVRRSEHISRYRRT